MLSPELSSAVESSARTAVYVDVGSQGGNEVKPSQTSPGGGSWTIKSSGGRGERIPTSQRPSECSDFVTLALGNN